jgi:superfamily II DNA/RNA helicase
MAHHVLHVRGDDRFRVLVDLLAAPGRTVVFTRTKRRAKVLAKQLVAAGVPAVELHGNLAQNARNRNLAAFSEGSAETLVATDIAARGIHVDDVALVIHADPPVEHKAYLHRSGRTARAGAQGTVITLMTDDQQAEVRDLTRRAGVRPTTSRTRPGDPLLAQLAPGERKFVAPPAAPAQPAPAGRPGRSRARGRGETSARTHGAETPTRTRDGETSTRTRGSETSARTRSAEGSTRARGAETPARTRGVETAARGTGNAAQKQGGQQGQAGGAARGKSRARRGNGSVAVHTSQSPGTPARRQASAASFSATTRAGGRRGGR